MCRRGPRAAERGGAGEGHKRCLSATHCVGRTKPHLFSPAVGVGMAEEEDPQYDVAVNVMKGKDGYGIYFTNKDGVIRVTKLDAGSEAARAGVQPGDVLYSVQDNDKKLPADRPGQPVVVSLDNYQETLQLVRQMSNCRLCFCAASGSAF